MNPELNMSEPYAQAGGLIGDFAFAFDDEGGSVMNE